MKLIELNNKIKIPVIGLGTWELTGENCVSTVKNAIKFGYRHIDTAEVYGNEKEIGKAIKGFDRNKLFITTKIWPAHLNDIEKTLDASLARLGTDYVDLYLLHWPNHNANMQKALENFKKIYDKGKIKSFGVSNFTINHLKEIIPICKKLKLPLSINQVEFHPYLYQKELLKFCNENNIVIIAYSPLARRRLFDNIIIKELAIKYKKTEAQIILKWILQKRIVAIPKAALPEHLKENIEIFDFDINKEDIERIDKINKDYRLMNPDFAEFNH